MYLHERCRLEQKRIAWMQIAQDFHEVWQECADFVSPRRIRIQRGQVNKGQRRNQKILDNTATLSLRTLSSGMKAGITSPARPWFRFAPEDNTLSENVNVKMYTEESTRLISNMFLKSNFYNTLTLFYKDLGNFGTSCFLMDEVPGPEVFNYTPLPIGSFAITCDASGKPNGLVYDFSLTVDQIVNDYLRDPEDPKVIHWENASSTVKTLYTQKNGSQRQEYIDCCRLIELNEFYDPTKLDSKYKKYKSVTFELGRNVGGTPVSSSKPGNDKLLKESGHDYFPAIVGRWERTGEDYYATAWPVLDAIGDIRQLQYLERKTGKALDKQIDPPMVGPAAMRNNAVSGLPGGMTYMTQTGGTDTSGLRAIYQIDYPLQFVEQKQEQTRIRIQRALYEDLMLTMIRSDRREQTATEVNAKEQEKLLVLGNVYDGLNFDLLNPIVDISYAVMDARGLLPEPPQELANKELKIVYESIMAQAQKALGIQGIERLAAFTISLAQADPTVSRKANWNNFVDEMADRLGAPASLVRPDEEVEQIAAQEAQVQAMQMQLQAAEVASKTGKNNAEAQAKMSEVA